MTDIKTDYYTLMQGDCLERMKEIPDGSVDMVMCDPPYGTTACAWDAVIPFEPMWTELKRVVKGNAVIVLMASQPFTSALIMSNPRRFRYSLVWVKNKVTGFLNAKKQPLRKHEDILIFYQGRCFYSPQKTTGHKPVNSYTKNTSDGDTVGATKKGITGGGSTERYPVSVLEFPVVNQDGKGTESRYHPTQKPVALMEYLIRTYSNENETILDFTMGSGTTGVAAMNQGRKFIGIERDDKYFAIAAKRVEGASNQSVYSVL
jgi:DNA modification methylase